MECDAPVSDQVPVTSSAAVPSFAAERVRRTRSFDSRGGEALRDGR